MPLSRELDPLFRSEVRKPPSGIGRTENVAGLGTAVWTRGRTRLDGQRGGDIRINIGALLRFQVDVYARFLGRRRVPSRPGEPQSSDGEQRRYCQEQMFCFHGFLLFGSNFTSTFTTALFEDLWELAFVLARRRGILVRSARKQE